MLVHRCPGRRKAVLLLARREVCSLVAGARSHSMVMVTVADASVPAREEQEAVGGSSMASGDLASSLHTQGTMRGPLLLL